MKTLKTLAKRWFVDGLSSMALGLFSSLIMGLIISQLSKLGLLSWLAPIGKIMQEPIVIGAAIGVAVGYGMKISPLAIFTCAAVGAYGYQLGGPMGAYVAAIAGAEIGNLASGKTKLDIILVPFCGSVAGCLVGGFVGPYIQAVMTGLGSFINYTTELHPVPMGILVSVIVGMVLTAPISSAAICISLELSGIAAGAATVGCCCNMLGFAIISIHTNGLGGFISQGLGTSMLQVPNIVKKPIIWLPAIISSAIIGPFATTLVKITNNPAGAGMGTSGLVGVINAFITMTEAGGDPVTVLIKIFVMLIILPLVVTYAVYLPFRRAKLIKDNDLKLSLTSK